MKSKIELEKMKKSSVEEENEINAYDY